jgi:hypothetical protein
MGGLSAADTVLAWETGAGLGPLDRALVMLWAARSPGDPADLPIAERDKRLLRLRAATFGDRLDCVATCPDCGEVLEFELDASDLATALVVPEPESVEIASHTLEQRPLTSRDLAAAATLPDDAAEAYLRHSACPGAETLPANALADLDARIAAREGAGEPNLSLACAACGTAWKEPLDIPGHVWVEIEAAARRIMTEVATIAAAFGWTERDILAMSEARRRTYLQIAGGP